MWLLISIWIFLKILAVSFNENNFYLFLVACNHSLTLLHDNFQVGVAEMKVVVERTGGLVVLAESFGHSVFKDSFKRIFEEGEQSLGLSFKWVTHCDVVIVYCSLIFPHALLLLMLDCTVVLLSLSNHTPTLTLVTRIVHTKWCSYNRTMVFSFWLLNFIVLAVQLSWKD